MRILFLHLSDIHIKDKNGVNIFQLRKIVDATNSFGTIDHILLVLSGDIAFSGERHQYESAYHCIGNIIAHFRRCGYTRKIDILCVPGNHDMDYNNTCRTSIELQAIRKVNSYHKHLPAELKKQINFFDFSKRNHCFETESVYCQRIIDLGSFKIEANLVNSGVFSILEEDKGLHHIPQNILNEMEVPTDSDFVITIMHHSPEWYADNEKNALERIIYKKSSIVFYGHEHYIGNKQMKYEGYPFALIQAGGKLANNDDWTQSSFHIGIFDSDTRKYSQYKYYWNAQQRQYEQTDTCEISLPNKPSVENKIQMTEDYERKLKEDSKHNISSSFLDYFVFPRLQSEELNGTPSREFISQDDFISDIFIKKKVLVCGGYNSGKTCLLKSLFLRLSDDYSILICDIADIRGKVVDRIIKNCFVNIYGESASDYARFQQTPKSRRILMIDDVDEIKPDSFEYLMGQLSEQFEYIILTSKQAVDIDLMDRMKVLLKASGSIYRYCILPVYSDKRKELIKKVVSIKIDDESEASRISELLTNSIRAQRRFISLDPDFIIKYVEYYCNNLMDAGSSDSGVFSKVFEANLTYALSRFQTTRLSVDKLFVLLSKIAHYIHFNKAYPISETQIFLIFRQYNEDYGATVIYSDALAAMCGAKILVTEVAGFYKFSDRSYLAYFVAREVNIQYNLTGDDTHLQTILKHACFGINADILMFISYITDNIRILNCILYMAVELTKEWPEFNFTDNLPRYLSSEKAHTVLPPAPDSKCKEELAEIDSERNMMKDVQTIDIYDYTEEDAERFVNQIIRAGSLLIIISKCLPNFEHNMRKPDKDRFVDAIFRIPNRIFGLWATETDKCVAEMIDFFKSQSQDYYTREISVDDDDILRALQWASISLLLDLYNISMLNAAKDNTSPYLSAFDSSVQSTYLLEHLMALERVGANSKFVSGAIELSETKACGVFSMALRRVVRHALVTMSGLDFRLRQQLEAKFFPAPEMQKRIMTQRIAIDGRKGE